MSLHGPRRAAHGGARLRRALGLKRMAILHPRLLLALILLFAGIHQAQADEWVFVWIASGVNDYTVSKGKAQVTLAAGKLEVHAVDKEGIEYTLRGVVKKNTVNARLTVLESDQFKDSPFSGTYIRKLWSGFADSKGRESISLSDGWNFIGLAREIR